MIPLFTIQEAPVVKMAVRHVAPGEFFIVDLGNIKEIHLRLPDDHPERMEGNIVALHFGKVPRYARFLEQTEVTVTRSEITLYKQSLIG